jgi:hypothetical protein
MTETLVGVSPPKEVAVSPAELELAAARELVKAARACGVALTGPDGLLKAITKTVLESGLEEEMKRARRLRQARRAGPQRRQLP